jgi:hypothetical protein
MRMLLTLTQLRLKVKLVSINRNETNRETTTWACPGEDEGPEDVDRGFRKR